MSAESDLARPAKRQRRQPNNDLSQPTQTLPSILNANYIGCLSELSQEQHEYHVACEEWDAYAARTCAYEDQDAVEYDEGQEEIPPIYCCYGMLPNIPLKPITLSCPSSNALPVQFEPPNTLHFATAESAKFQIMCPTSCRILSELEAVAEVTMQLYCHTNPGSAIFQRSRFGETQGGRGNHTWVLNIILYGTVALQDAIGEFLSGCQMYLQDPYGCDRSLVYRNPHIISAEYEEVVMADSFNFVLDTLEIERVDAGPDLLAQLMENETPLPESEAPSIVTTKLFPHQKQALTFMLRREQGWAMDEKDRDIWAKHTDHAGRSRFTNNVTGTQQYESPEDFQGGLLADDMGLGKTLSMICLIAANQAQTALPSPPITPEPFGRGPIPELKTTLLIVPPSLMQSWEKQLDMHIRPHTLKWHIFHGSKRNRLDYLGQFDIVITTFHTVSAIWRKQNGNFQSMDSIFSVLWHRVILDEAHLIQNPQSQLTQACYAVRSPRRWAITGTPIQNKLTDFASIVKFLKVYPYSEPGRFEEDIYKPWHCGDQQGFLRLKKLVGAITISRTKAVVELPLRINEIHHLDFSPAERIKYDIAEAQVKPYTDNTLPPPSRPGSVFNKLQQLNNLRLICSHGLLAQSIHERQSIQALTGLTSVSDSIVQLAAHEALERGESTGVSTTCSQCCSDILLDPDVPSCNFSVGKETICSQCITQLDDVGGGQLSWNQMESFEPLGTTACSPLLSPNSDITSSDPIDSMSTKIKALIVDLLKHIDTTKSVVFSFWTYTLDLIQLMLDYQGVPYVRIDGKTSLSKRTMALRTFQNVESVRVILVSISCGGAGLDLTAASRAYLMEPHWNPMIEEQALCRVHRVGQKCEVTTVRYLIRESFEEQIVELQKRKRMLADLTFGQAPLQQCGIELKTMKYLKSVVG